MEPLPNKLSTQRGDRPEPIASFMSLQEWDGYVVDVGPRSFRARIVDVAGGDKDNEEAEVEISLEELDEESQSLLEKGRLFRWSIGYQRFNWGQKLRVSRIIIRRLPAWSSADLSGATRNAAQLSQQLKWD